MKHYFLFYHPDMNFFLIECDSCQVESAWQKVTSLFGLSYEFRFLKYYDWNPECENSYWIY